MKITAGKVGREAIIVILGAVVAAWVLYQMPHVRDYIAGAKKSDCNCRG